MNTNNLIKKGHPGTFPRFSRITSPNCYVGIRSPQAPLLTAFCAGRSLGPALLPAEPNHQVQLPQKDLSNSRLQKMVITGTTQSSTYLYNVLFSIYFCAFCTASPKARGLKDASVHRTSSEQEAQVAQPKCLPASKFQMGSSSQVTRRIPRIVPYSDPERIPFFSPFFLITPVSLS